jgi:hypothetical protein
MMENDREQPFYEDYDYEFPPVRYPWREAATMCVAAALVLGGIGWLLWRLW